MSWLDVVSNGRGVVAVFGGEAPELRSIVVHSVTVHRDGPTVTLVFDLPDYPSAPPAKWAAQGFTTVQLVLSCVGAEEIRLTGWGTDVVGDLSIERAGDRIAVALDTPVATLTLTALAVDVQKVSAYQDGGPDAAW
jgi:immunity protein 50 of polymorphic toxin system